MKKNFKLMTAAMALVALSSCTDDLTVNGSQKGLYGKDDLVASLNFKEPMTRFAVQEESDKVKGGNKFVVWSNNDKIRIFTLDKLSQDLYQLKSGAGEANAVFQRIADSGLSGDKYAITEATSIYGVSATNVNGKDLPLLTVTLPGEYTVGDDDQGNKNFPVPYWGKATVTGSDEDTYINASFSGLAAFLRVSLNELPAGTRAIVLTTHGDRTGNQPEEGFQISKTFPAKDLQQQGGTMYWADHAKFPVTTGGKSEAISGTLNAILDPSKNPDDVFLTIDDRLVKSDTLRVNLTDKAGNYIYDPATENQVFYIPIVVGTYENLHVLAVTGDSKYSYTWVGEELHNFRNQEFVNNTPCYLDMNQKTYAKADLNTINQAIAKLNTTAGMMTVINVEELVNDSEDGLNDNDGAFSSSKIKVLGEGDLVLNIKKMTEFSVPEGFTVQEGEEKILATETPTSEFNFDPEYAKPVNIQSPLRKVVLGTVGGANSSSIEATVLGTDTKYVMGFDIYKNIEEYKFMVAENSAVTIKNGLKKVTVKEGTVGDIFVYSDAEETELLALDVQSTANNNVRISSALVKDIKMADVADGQREIWTDGRAAMQTVTNAAGSTYPKNTQTYSYYTGAGLSDYAWQNGYDQENIYTAAQLQSMGAAQRTIGTLTVPNRRQSGTYRIPNAFVGKMWLGSTDIPWIGPEVTINDFKLDGELTSLQNMKVDVEGVSNTIYIDDPHYCCTSCGLPGTETTLAISNDLGLIRSIKGSTPATVTNINLNDVLIDTKNKIDNIGAIIGNVDLQGAAFTFTNNVLGEVKIRVNGDNIGGMIGKLKAGKIDIIGNKSISKDPNKTGGYVKSAKGFVGGLVGNVESTTEKVTLNSNIMQMKDNIEAGKGYAAGLVGSMKAKDDISVGGNIVETKDITAVDSYAAGMIAYLETTGMAGIGGNAVTAANISTDKLYAGGLAGQVKVGAAQAQPQAQAQPLWLLSNTVTVNTALAAEEGQLGGLVGNAASGNVYVNSNATSNQNTTVTIGKMSGAYAAGGILGSNDTNVPLTVFTGHKDAPGAWTNKVKVTVNAYENTKSATYFTGGDTYKYGTMQDIVGLKQSSIFIYTDRLETSGVLDDAAKKAVHYDAHVDSHHTMQPGEYYWGDNKGYVGFGYTGDYIINASSNYSGAIVPVYSEVEGGYNYFQAY